MHSTRRLTVPAMEEVLYERINVLDHGFIRVVDYMGGDDAIVQAARVSYGTGTKHVSEDRALIRYLMRHRHTSPFEMCEIKLHCKMPIFVARQWVRHRTASINEYSARYSVLDDEFYIPPEDQLRAQSASNKQGRGELLPVDRRNEITRILKEDAERCYDHYEEMLQPAGKADAGLARELARINLTLNYYTQWYWKIDLHNLLHFLQLRMDEHAQFEIRVYAYKIAEIVKKWVPITWSAFEDYRLHGVTLSRTEAEILREAVDDHIDIERCGLSKREVEEFKQKFFDRNC